MAISTARWPRSTALIQAQPNNPYFYELRGQALLEGGRPNEAIAPLHKALALSNNAPLIEMLLGQALVATDNKAYTDEAIAILRAAVVRETEAPLGFSQLAMAYGKKGDYAEADLASAQAAYLRGDIDVLVVALLVERAVERDAAELQHVEAGEPRRRQRRENPLGGDAQRLVERLRAFRGIEGDRHDRARGKLRGDVGLAAAAASGRG